MRSRQGSFITVGNVRTHFHEAGSGPPVILLHGSGPGVSAWENWSGVFERLADSYRVIAPDMAGFGLTEILDGQPLDMKLWFAQLTGLLDALDTGPAVLVGNSFGGGLSLATTFRDPARVRGLVLMGTPFGRFEQTAALHQGTEYTPSLENMRGVLAKFPNDPSIITADMVQARYEMSLRHPDNAALRALMPERPTDGQPVIVRGAPLERLAEIRQPTLILHGREDIVIPMEVAVNAARHMPDSELHLFGRCGHWVQLERPDAFVLLTRDFLARRMPEAAVA
ncbi:MAG: 2-hydroxy-6-oxo-2,4-heptadienoate hydrolase [Phenylobacterium zucineum]|nr:MAG: 2-hydroxy-6-oxo-2,4-heptadienoate hydrolase [Phenylobacterium zucineum]